MKERKLDFYAWYPGDFRKDTAHLSRDERHAYRDLLDEIFIADQKNCSLPNDDFELARIVGRTESEWREMRRALIDGRRALLKKSGKRVYSKRLREEIGKAKEKAGRHAEAAQKRWTSDADATHMQGTEKARQSKSKKKPSVSKREKRKTPPTVGVLSGAPLVKELRALGVKVGNALAERWAEAPGQEAVIAAVKENRDSILAADHPTQYLAAIVRNLGNGGPVKSSPDGVTLAPRTRRDELLDLIHEYKAAVGERPFLAPKREHWDAAFAVRFGFTPDDWNEHRVSDESIETALAVTA